MVTTKQFELERVLKNAGFRTATKGLPVAADHVFVAEWRHGDLTAEFDGENDTRNNALLRDTLKDARIPFKATKRSDGTTFTIAANSEVSPFKIKPEKGMKVFEFKTSDGSGDRFVTARSADEATLKARRFFKGTKVSVKNVSPGKKHLFPKARM